MKTGQEETYLYEQLAQELSQQISDGVYAVGEKLPSIRKLCAQRRISVATAMQALSILESRGMIEARPKSGYFIRHSRFVFSRHTASHLKPFIFGMKGFLLPVSLDMLVRAALCFPFTFSKTRTAGSTLVIRTTSPAVFASTTTARAKPIWTYTHKNGPWRLTWSESHESRSAAMRREREIKGWKSARRIREELLNRQLHVRHSPGGDGGSGRVPPQRD